MNAARPVLILFVATTFLFACAESPESSDPVGAGDEAEHSGTASDDRVLDSTVEAAREAAAAAALVQLRPDVIEAPDVMHDLPLHHPALLAALVEIHEHRAHFVEGSLLSARGNALWGQLQGAAHHAIFPEDVHVPAIAARLARLGELPDPNAEVVTDDAVLRSVAETRSELELLLADALLEWSVEMAHGNPAAVPDETRRLARDGRLIREAMIDGFAEAVSSDDLALYLARLPPSHEQYARLQGALVRYQTIRDQGGWAPVNVDAPLRSRGEGDEDILMRRGDSGPAVEVLQRRLAAEGYYEGAIDGEFGSDLRDGLRDYQRTHQLSDDGDVEPEDLASLNKPVERRIAEIEVTIDRWRDSRIGDDPTYVHVNVPDFHGELWRDGARIHRFAVIVGNSSRFYDEIRDTNVWVNATPLISAAIDFLIFNPYWTPTPRLVRELEEKVAEEGPQYLEENGFEVKVSSSGSKRYRQLPGPKNALGKVKFQFPNRYDVYMHDTDKPWLFRHEVRAFSHGCIRVEDPLVFAEELFEIDQRTRPEWAVGQYLAGGQEDWTELRSGTIPVHVEYYTVRVDDDGATHFGADIYRYDKPRVHERMVRRGWRDDETDAESQAG